MGPLAFSSRVLMLAVAVHIAACPFTKVEESFNLQACHDILFQGTKLQQYDHHEFPGVVPRTFVGPLAVSAVAFPFVAAEQHLGASKLLAQATVRLALGAMVAAAFMRFRRAVQLRLGNNIAKIFLLLCACQFHLPFYMSRPLPNVFALAMVMLASAYWLEGKHTLLLRTVAFVVLVFRSELVLLFGPLLLMELFRGRVSLGRILLTGIPAGLLSIAFSVAVDSWFWRRWLWPEGEVLHYNTVMNKSGDWGTMPFAWYFYSALPRACNFSLLAVPIGVYVNADAARASGLALAFVLLYSFLPHKELRFIIYAVPLLNLAAAAGIHHLWFTKRRLVGLLQLAVVGGVMGTLAFTGLLGYMSHHNYAGGAALTRLHTVTADLPPPTTPYRVQIENMAAQTGVSRFGETSPEKFSYHKVEDWPSSTLQPADFEYVLAEPKDFKLFAETHEVMEDVLGFAGIRRTGKLLPPLDLPLEPKLSILRRKGSTPASPGA